jgi:hypothetical protein
MFLFRNAPVGCGLEDKDMRSLPLQHPQPLGFPGHRSGPGSHFVHAPDWDMRFTGMFVEQDIHT